MERIKWFCNKCNPEGDLIPDIDHENMKNILLSNYRTWIGTDCANCKSIIVDMMRKLHILDCINTTYLYHFNEMHLCKLRLCIQIWRFCILC